MGKATDIKQGKGGSGQKSPRREKIQTISTRQAYKQLNEKRQKEGTRNKKIYDGGKQSVNINAS